MLSLEINSVIQTPLLYYKSRKKIKKNPNPSVLFFLFFFFLSRAKFSWTCFCQATEISHWARKGVNSLRICLRKCLWNLLQLNDLPRFRLKWWGQIRAEYLEGLHSFWYCSQGASCMGNGIFTNIQPPSPSGPTEFSAWYNCRKHFWKTRSCFCRDYCPITNNKYLHMRSANCMGHVSTTSSPNLGNSGMKPMQKLVYKGTKGLTSYQHT